MGIKNSSLIINEEEKDLEEIEILSKTGSWEIDLKTKEVFWSKGVYKMLGYEANEFDIDFEKAFATVHPDDQKRAVDLFEQVVTGNTMYEIQKKLICANGNHIHVRSVGKIVKDEDQNPIKLIGIFHNITDFINANDEIRTIRTITENIVNSLDCIFWEFNMNNNQLSYINNKAEKMLGFTADNFLHNPKLWFERIHPEDKQKSQYDYFKRAKSNSTTVIEYRFLTKANKYIWIRDRITKVVEKNGDKLLRGLLVNITKEKETESKIKMEKELNKRLFQNLPNMVFIFNKKNEFLLWNNKIIEISGYNEQEMKSLSPFDFFEPNQKELITQNIDAIFDKNIEIEIETLLITKTKKTKPILFIATKFNYMNKDCIYGIGIDLTQKNMLVNKQKKLTETIENIIQFAPESLVVVDHQKNIFKKNKAFDKLINEYAPKLQYTKPELKKLILQQIMSNTLDDGKKTITIEKNEKNKKI